MAHIIKIKNEYFVEYWAQGLRFQKKGGSEETMAQKLLDEITTSVPERIEDIYKVREDQFCDVVAAFEEYLSLTVSLWSRVRLLDYARALHDHLIKINGEGTLIQNVTPRVLNEYFHSLKNKGVSPKSRAASYYLLKIFFDYAVGFGAINDNPLIHINGVEPNPFYKPVTLHQSQLEKLTAQCEPQLKAIAITAFSTGLANNELKRLRVEDFDFQDKIISFDQRRWPADVFVLNFISERADQPFAFDVAQINEFKERFSDALVRNTFAKMVLARGASLMQLTQYLKVQDIYRVLPYTHFIQSAI